MKYLTFFIILVVKPLLSISQEYHTHAFFANQSRLPIEIQATLNGNTSMLEINKLQFLPYEITHDHSSTIAIGDILQIKEKDHNENNSTLLIDRRRNFGNQNSHSVLDITSNQQKLFSIHITTEDKSGASVNVYYNIQYLDGSFEFTTPGKLHKDNKRDAQIASKWIEFNGHPYKLVFGSFDENLDDTDNLIFSMSNLVDTIYRYDAPIKDTSNPYVLHILTYNPGILMPLGISDQDEDERSKVMHKALPKNMDIIVFQEFFEAKESKIILDNLSPWYPFQTKAHNKILIPGIGKEGGGRIVSKYPIIEEDEISFSENGCVPEDFFSKFANKGVKYVKINKKGQIIHVFGTHTSLQPCDLYIMGQFIASKNLPKDEVVIMAGDFNVDMNRYKNGSDDYTIMLDTLNALEPTYLSFLNDWTHTGTTTGLNHMYCCNPHSRQQLDYVLVSSNHKIPTLLTNRSLQARLNEPDESFGIFDMGDHEPVYARIEFPSVTSSENNISACIEDHISFKTIPNQFLDSYNITWYHNDQLISDANKEELFFILQYPEQYGDYSAVYTYAYLPDTNINNFFDPSYMDYKWYFRGATSAELKINFSISPINLDTECSGFVTSTKNVQQYEWKIYPNPAQNSIEIKGVNRNDIIAIECLDISGRKVWEIKNNLEKQDHTIDISNLHQGIYIIRINNNKGQFWNYPLVIQR